MNPLPSSMGDIKLSYRFLIIGILSFLFYLIFFYQSAFTLSEGIYHANDIWVLAHTFILGFLIMVVMGVMYQLVPVALFVSIYSNRLSRIQFWTYVTGVIGLVYGLWTVNTAWMALFGSLAFTGVLLFVLNIFLGVGKIPSWNMMSVIIVTAVFYLFMTVLFGLLLVLDYQYGWFTNVHEQIFYSHILFGTVGWLTSVIIGFSYKMAPMFSLAHGYSDQYAKWIYLAIQSGIILTVTGIFGGWTSLILFAFGLLLVGFLLFAYQIKLIIKHKMKSKLDIGFQAAIYAVYFAAGLFSVSPIGFFLFKEAYLLPFAYLFIMGWIGFSILGYLFKIIPFLCWTDKYSEKVGKENVPMLKDMVDEKKGKWAFLLLFIGLIGNALAIGVKLPIGVIISNSIMVMGGFLYSYLVLRIFKM
ncbi:hypothetical protein [Tepidibacillus sp. HK-1]|uniref:hypothetical protein n=1 Tax=Tepidibacillus sp. HK-1 TaxID=1883407 RepID=UPI0008529FBF|nr:hypothetical protein [Tepidibacillus sp. HK-1]GBF11174.1 hypothetical protein HK1_01197 [Tepidibacillus sp. HK-1]